MIRVSASAFDILWHDLGHGRVPSPLEVRSVGVTEAERAEIRRAVHANLAERGLLEGGRLDAALESRLATLASAEVYVECEALPELDAEAPFRAVAAAGGRRGVLAAQPSRTIGLSGIRDTEIFTAVVDLLPPLEPGPGYGVSLPADTLAGEGGSRAAARQLAEVRAIQSRPVLGAGQFTVRARAGGRPRRVGGVSWFRTDQGAYLGTVEPGRGGAAWVNVVPTDSARLAARVADLVG
ncbi:ESX secretion-associated protein EspG [Amycolatopsis thermoflava]|uniref:ESAT-6 protein secretion system EspG family protein n=1 Tax=Amycolatopsis thermoflava TaxID=84480 RepID=A0A3N2GP71_9PSEU|nr:ESX secretion-associated protein EspG [Amycolatopsis thermoflava]ROS38303.1 ESAT-6 protein secretion system EspG family protein [Amycolatopsis thermoflava]